MTLVITHPYVSSVTETTPSGGPGGNVGPSEWNANHTLTGLVSPAQGGTGITSGTGVTFFSSATVIADSGTLTANAVVLGGGANTAPTVVGTVGTTSQILFGGAGGAAPAWGTATSLSSPAGSNTNIQFNNSGVFGGDGNFTYTSGGAGVSIKLTSSTSTGLAGLSIATSSSSQMQSDAAGLKILPVWNNSSTIFDAPLFMNVINTASAGGSLMMDLQTGGSTIFGIGFSGSNCLLTYNSNLQFFDINNTDAMLGVLVNSGRGFQVRSDGYLGLNPNLNVSGAPDIALFRQAAGIFAIADGASPGTATGLRVYNTVDVPNGAPTNYERGVFDWTTNTNVLTIGTQNGGTGSVRDIRINRAGGAEVNIISGGIQFGDNTIYISRTWNQGSGQRVYSIISGGGFGWVPASDLTQAVDTVLTRTIGGVISFSNSMAASANAWINWGGQARVTSNVTSTTTSFADITGMKVTLQASRSYSFRAEIIATCSSSGGIQVAASSTTTSAIPTIQIDGYAVDTALPRGYSQQTTLNSAVIATTITGTALHAHLYGTVTTTTTGASFKLQVAQQNLSATQTIVLAGSYLLINDTP